MITLLEQLAGVARLAFDTAPIIYLVEEHPHYLTRVRPAFESVARGNIRGIASVLTLLEVLVQPLRRNARALQQAYTERLLHSAYFETHAIDVPIAEQAADLRARYNLRTPDALQLATALYTDCEAFLTNDLALKRVSDLHVIVVDELD